MTSYKEALQFYLDNGLEEVISEKSQNYFLQKDKEKPQKQPEKQKTFTVNNFVKPEFSKITSTSDALSSLAKKFQPNSTNMASEEKFRSLNEIVAQAQKLASAAKDLAELRQAVENFDGCNLKKMATNTVFCDGNANSKVMVIGEAPGNHEDLQGIPFCGDSGKLLDEMLRSVNLTRKENFYITNVIFWRPPGNRRPTDEELAICRPFVERHIQLVSPEVLVLVGATSMSAVLGIHEPVSKIRGQFMDFAPKFLEKPTKTFTIFHPSYLLRQPGKKKVAWQDMLALEKFLMQPPSRR